MSKFLVNLNKQQELAVIHDNGPLAIIASAGSGKTRVITHKIAYLIEEKQYKPYRILAVTFTNKAAKEMKERIISMIGEVGEDVKILTYHSMCVRILREEIQYFDGYEKKFNILDPADQRQILSGIYRKLGISSKTLSYTSAIDFISHAKNDMLNPEVMIDEAKSDTDKFMATIYRDYVLETARVRALDFDDLLLFVHKLFKEQPEVAKKWANKFDYVLVDEFQDTSIVQYEIMKALVNKNNLTIVGDPDQTIYTWRRADVSLINNFQHHFEGSTIIKLELNYRSTKTILDKANALIKHNTRRIDKKLVATKSDGDIVEFYHGFSDDAEARWIAQKIQELKRNKVQLKNIAILYRANYLSAAIEKALIQENINYTVWGGTRFYQREEIKDAISFLKIINNGDEVSLRRMINIPARKIGLTSQEAIFTYQEEKNLPLWEVITKHLNALPISTTQKLSLAAFINLVNKYRAALKSNDISTVLDKFLIEVGYISNLSPTEDLGRIENIKELVKILKDWTKENEGKSLDEYLDEVSLFLDVDHNSAPDYVTLMTVHTSKGLEFDNVFIAGFSDSIFPSARALEEEDGEGIEEERRLAYVAITRAKERLYITDSKGYSVDFKFQKKPSRFLKEMGINIREFTTEFIAPKSVDENYVQKERNFIQGDEINHEVFGNGVIVNVSGDLISIAFKGPHGVKTLMKNHKAIQKIGGE